MTAVWTVLSITYECLVALAVVAVLRRPREPRAMWAWILALIFIPVLGLVLFILLGEPRIRRTRRRRRRRRLHLVRSLRQNVSEPRSRRRKHPTAELDASLINMMQLASRVGGRPAVRGNEVTIYHSAEQTFADLKAAIDSARSHVHLEYYIFQPDETGTAIRDLLARKAAEGVRCRMLLDYVGCWWLSRSFLRPLRDAGVEVEFFMPVVPLRGRWRVNFRNHRKILIVDGNIAFTGSQNIGNEYAGRRTRVGRWRDTHMRMVGPAVHHLQEIFIEDWHFTTRRDLTGDECFPATAAAGDQVVQVIASGPDGDPHTLYQVLLAAFNAASESVCVVTPYFVPDAAILLSLQAAAYRGVRVQLMVPSRSDHRVVLWAGRSYYNELIRAGVEVYEYPHAMLHSKVVVIDRKGGIVGSANMDERSFRLNFELSVVLYDESLAGELYDDFVALRERAKRRRFVRSADLSLPDTLKLGFARLASPLL